MNTWLEFVGYLGLIIIGFVWGREWRQSAHEREIESWERLAEMNHITIQRFVKHLATEKPPDERFDWKAGTGVE